MHGERGGGWRLGWCGEGGVVRVRGEYRNVCCGSVRGGRVRRGLGRALRVTKRTSNGCCGVVSMAAAVVQVARIHSTLAARQHAKLNQVLLDSSR